MDPTAGEMVPKPKKRGYKLQDFEAHNGDVRSAAIGKKTSRVLATGGDDCKVNLWAIGGQTPVLSLSGHTSAVEAVQFDSTEVFVAAGSSNGSIKLWDLEEAKGVVLRSFTGHTSSCTAVDFHPFGEFFASGSLDTNLKLWDIRRKRCVRTFKGHREAIKKVRFTPDGRWVVTGGEDNIVNVWDLTAGKLLHDFKLHSGQINCIDFHPYEFLLATGSADRTVKFWDLETFELIGSSQPEITGARSVVFHPNGNTLFCGLDQSLKAFSWEPAVTCHDVIDMEWSNLADLTIIEGKLLGCSYHERRVGVWVADISVAAASRGAANRKNTAAGSHFQSSLDGSPKLQSITGRRLRVRVVEGRALTANSKSGKCDPYVKLQYGKALYQTKTLSHTVRPIWNDKFEFDEIAGGEYLKIKCYNADMFGDESIGSARVNLEGLLDGASRDVWVPLEKVDSGEIRLEIEPIKNDHNKSMQSSSNKAGAGWIELVIIEARDLVATDLRGTSDPYVRVQYGNKKKRTKVIYKTLSPQWNQTFEFPETGEPLVLHVKDHNALLSTASIGHCTVEYIMLSPNQPADKWIPLQGVKSGEVHVKVARRVSVSDMHPAMVLQEPQELSVPIVHEDSRHMELNILERIVDGSQEPSHLSLPLLQSITENFSIKTKIGNGGCGDVYKGVLRNGIVAVKRLYKNITIKDKMFHREVKSLITVKHENIVRFLGYCSFTEERVLQFKEGNVMVDIRERLLCFEYISNGSLENHITDELRGLEWSTRHKIIVGICKGLLYLHSEKNIIHMDLKPANILLDDQMVPKITDFGLARLDNNSETTTTRFVSLGYSAPEYLLEGKSSSKSDIYSLGVIIIELVTGSKRQPNITKVLRKWRHRWSKSSMHVPLGYQQLTKCLLLGLRCTQVDPADRPSILDVIDVINEIDSNKDEKFQVIPCLEDMLGIKPLEIQFPFALGQQMSHSVELTNDTDDYIAFRIIKAGLPCLHTEPKEGIVPPQSNFGATLTMEAQDKALPNTESWEKLTVQSTRVDGNLAATHITGDMFVETDNKVVDEVDLTVDFGRPPLQEES